MRSPELGRLTEKEYLALPTTRLVEFSYGCLEYLPAPTLLHQFIVKFLFGRLDSFVSSRQLGDVLFAPLPVRQWPGKLREPDIVFLRPGRYTNVRNQPDGADLAVEVVSEGAENRERDLETKRQEYAQAGIAEYWIVDPEKMQIIVLVLDGQSYREHGIFGSGTVANSVLLSGFEIPVDEVFAAGNRGA